MTLVSGLVCDRGLTLGDLIGVLHDFFSRIGKECFHDISQQKDLGEPSYNDVQV